MKPYPMRLIFGALFIAALSAGAEAQTPIQFKWSSAGPIAGMVCTQVIEGASPIEHTWRDNYICTTRDIGLRWSSSGPIAGMTCTQIFEGAEPVEYTWRDNYLCLPQGSRIALSWSSSGPIEFKYCVQMHEGRDPYTWHDNYLCWDEDRRSADLLTITKIQCIKPSSGLDPAGKAVFGTIGAAISTAASGGISLGDLYNGAKYGVKVGEYLDQAFSGTENLILKVDGRQIFPVGKTYEDIDAGQVIYPNVQAAISGAGALQLIDWDKGIAAGGSDNDNLGIHYVLGGRDYTANDLVILAPSSEEGSIFVVSYRVERGRGNPQALVRSMLCGTNQCDECYQLDCANQPYDQLDRDGDKPDLLACPPQFTEMGFIKYPQVFEDVYLRVCRHKAAR